MHIGSSHEGRRDRAPEVHRGGRRARRCVASGAVAALFVTASAHAGDVRPTAAAFLDIDTDVRSAAMAGTGLVGPPGPGGITANPSRLSDLSESTVSAMHAAWFQGLSVEWIGYSSPMLRDTGFGLGLTFLRSDALIRFDELGNDAGEFHAYDAALSFGIGSRIGPVQLGASSKLIRQSLDDVTSNGLAVDVGATGRVGRLHLAGALTNAGGDMTIDGESFPLPTQIAFAAALPRADNRATLTAAIAFPSNYHEDVRLGAEVYASDALALRGGYRVVLGADDDEPLTGVTFGAGFWVSGLQIDYAYQPFRNLGDTHRMGVSLGFDAIRRGGTRMPPARIPATTKPPGRADAAPPIADPEPVATHAPPADETPALTDASGRTYAANAMAGRTRRRPSTNSVEVVGGTYAKRLDALRGVNELKLRGVPGGQVRLLPDGGGFLAYFGTFPSEPAAREWMQIKAAGAPAGALSILPLAGEDYPHEIVGARHMRSLAGYRELLAYRAAGLEGGTISREADGSYRVILAELSTRSAARRWLASEGQKHDPAALEVLPAPR